MAEMANVTEWPKLLKWLIFFFAFVAVLCVVAEITAVAERSIIVKISQLPAPAG